MRRFRDRGHAGQLLAGLLADHDLVRPLVLALPRGGVPVAAPVSAALGAPMEVFVVRKIGLPGRPELGVGALAEGAEPLLDAVALRRLGATPADLAAVVATERRELARRVARYRAGRPPPAPEGRDVVLVDDGLATGGTARAALRALRAAGARRLVLTVPVCPADTVRQLAGDADEVVSVLRPARLGSVGQWYERFDQTDDAEVLALLERQSR